MEGLGTYDDIAPVYDSLHMFEQLQKLKIIGSALKIKYADKLLDVGCGTGISAQVFNCDITGIDSSEKMISIAREKHPEHKWLVSQAEDLPFDNEGFDKVICVTAIHNFDDINKALDEMIRVSKPSKIPNIAISILKKSKKLDEIEKLIKEKFNVKKIIVESRDIIYFLSHD